jgi:RimJ/RimL family protein N-acetyltransferase
VIWLQPGQAGFDVVADTLARAIGGKLDGIEQGTVAAVLRGGALVGAFAVTGWRPDQGTAELHAAGKPGWVTRKAMADLMGYLFGQLGCQAVIMRTDATNDAACRVLRRYGLEEVHIPHARGRDKPEAVFVLTRDKAARFLEN